MSALLPAQAVRPAGPADIEPICRLLHEQMNRRLAPERWRRLMTYDWLEEKPDLGRVAEVEGRVAGYIGMVHADRLIAGRWHRVVNICSWYLDKTYRGRGLGFELMRSATADPACTYTNLTSSRRTLGMLDALGYRILDSDRRVWSAEGPPGHLTVERDGARILPRLAPAARRMLADHAGLVFMPVLFAADEGECLALFSVKKKGSDVTYYDALHISDPAIFARHAQAIANELLPRDVASVLAVDTRLLAGHPAGGRVEQLPVARYFKSSTLAPADIDNMYSEVLLLDLKLD